MRRTEKSVLLFVRLKFHKEGSLTMKELEIVMDIETLEVYEVIDHDQEVSSESTEEEKELVFDNRSDIVKVYQLDLFEEMNLLNTS